MEFRDGDDEEHSEEADVEADVDYRADRVHPHGLRQALCCVGLTSFVRQKLMLQFSLLWFG